MKSNRVSWRGSSALSDRHLFPFAVSVILSITLTIAFAGLNRAPLEAHEAFVVQAAREMHERGDWVVPYFHREPRLNKPPLSYWLTMLLATISNHQFEPWHGRAVSAVAWVLLVALTMWIGRMLFTRSVALLAGLFAATSTALADFSHNARPDMLYAALCTLILALFVYSWRHRGQGWRCVSVVYLMWACVGLAILTKGPHQPLIFIAAFGIIVLTHRRSRPHFWRILRPVSGLALSISVALPWWLMLRARVGGETLGDSQLGGTRYGVSITHIFDPLYLWQGWKMLLPWVIVWPAFLTALVGRSGGGGRARFLALLIGLTLLVLAFGGGKRWHYVLPLAAPAFILMAIGARRMLQTFAARPARWHLWLLLGQGAAFLGILLIAAVLPNRSPLTGSDHALLAVCLVLICLLLGTLAALGSGSRQWAPSDWRKAAGCTAGIAAVFLVAAEVTGILETDRDWNRVRFWQTLKDRIDDQTPVFALDVNASLSGFYGQRHVTTVESIDELIESVASVKGRGAAVVLPHSKMAALEGRIPLAPIAAVDRCDDDGETWVLGLSR